MAIEICSRCGKGFEPTEPQQGSPICPACLKERSTRAEEAGGANPPLRSPESLARTRPEAPGAVGHKSTVQALRDTHGIEEGVSLSVSDEQAREVTRLFEEMQSKDGSDRRYLVDGEIGRGGMGTILQSFDKDMRRQVAMKVMLSEKAPSREDIQRFIEEAQVTGQLEHPNIVPVHELGVDNSGHAFFTMKRVRGRSLQDVLHGLAIREAGAVKKYPLSELLNIFLKVSDAIGFAHSRGVVHRDIKPDNVMVGEFGEVLVMDWGLAKIKGREDAKAKDVVETLRSDIGIAKTLDGMVAGTPSYMSPEQAKGNVDEIDERSDIYSLGAVLYEMLCLWPPFRGPSANDVINKVMNGMLDPPDKAAPDRNIPRELAAVCMKAMGYDKEDRYQAAGELSADIRLYLEGRAVSAKEDTFREAIVKLVKRNREIFATAAAAALVLAVSGTIAVTRIVKERNRAVSAEKTAVAEREKAEDNLAKFLEAEDGRLKALKRGAPALVAQARNAMKASEFEDALSLADVAIRLDPALSEARLLRAQLLIHDGRYEKAADELNEYVRLKPRDENAMKLLGLCKITASGSDPSETAAEFGAVFSAQKAHALAEYMTRPSGKPLATYRKKIEEKLPGFGNRLQAVGGGILTLDLKDSKVTNLAFLRGIPLGELDVSGFGCGIGDLSPLEGMSLRSLNIENQSKVKDLSPLKNMPLVRLVLSGCRGIRNLGPLQGMKLERLVMGGDGPPNVEDLSPLAGMPIEHMDLKYMRNVKDLSPLKGMPLEHLDLSDCRSVTDLGPLRGAPLEYLNLSGSRYGAPNVEDLSPLKGMPLETLVLTGFGSLVNNISPLKGMKLKSLDLQYFVKVRNLSPLKEMPLESLDLGGMRGGVAASDLSPLEGMPLKRLNLFRCPNIKDLRPLLKCAELEHLVLPGPGFKDIEFLRGKKGLMYLGSRNHKEKVLAGDFWRRFDRSK